MSISKKSHFPWSIVLVVVVATFFLCWSAMATEAPQTVIKNKSFDEARVDMLMDTIKAEILDKKLDRAPLLIKAAKQGNLKACNTLGWLFDHGIGVKQDSSKAVQWFMSCAEQNPIAAYNAGVLYFEGRGVSKNVDKGVMLFKKSWSIGSISFRGGMPQIPIRLAYYYRKKKADSDALEWAERASIFNVKHGNYLLARMMVEKKTPYNDDGKALEYLNAATEAGSGPAAALLSWCYGTGRLSDKSYLLAREFELIAMKMDPSSVSSRGGSWSYKLNSDEKEKSETLANNWVASHKFPPPMDFTSTVD